MLQRNDVRDKFLFNLDIYYVLIRVLILRLSTIVKEIYIYLKQYYYHYYYIILFLFIFFFFFKLSVRQFANKKSIWEKKKNRISNIQN